MHTETVGKNIFPTGGKLVIPFLKEIKNERDFEP